MEKLKGENINVLPFKEIKKVCDLIYFEGPILSHFKDKYGKNILFYWVDLNDVLNRWLVFQISQDQLYKYLSKNTSLRNIIEAPINDIFYSVEIGDKLEYKNIVQIFKDELIEKYIPDVESFYESEVPAFYLKGLKDYQETFLMESFLSHAIYIKAEPNKKTKSKNHGLVDVVDCADFLYGYGNSYKALLVYEVRREFQNRDIVDEKRVRKATKQVVDASLLNLVKSKAASFAIALSPNNITVIDESFLNKQWRDGVFQLFKRDVVTIDQKTEEEVDQIIKERGENYTYDVYKPIIDLYNNKNIEINITDKNFASKRTINSVNENVAHKILTKEKAVEPPVDRLALVKFNSKTGKITGTAKATLFDQAIQTSWVTDEIRTEKRNYKLKHKIFAGYRIENSLHIIDEELFGIYATGDSLQEAEANFYEEFHKLNEFLTGTENKDLSAEEIETKNTMSLYLKKAR